MSTKIDANGRRYVQSETEVPGTPQQVWQAIATGPGVSAWFVPCQMDQEEGGQIVATFGPGMESTNTIKTWDPPHSFSAEGGQMSPGAPIMATEWTVEARDGGTCLVRVVHSWFAETDEWDGQFEGTETGWPAFFRVLAVYLANFCSKPSGMFQHMAMTMDSQEQAWAKLVTALDFAGKGVGDSVSTPSGAPKISGKVHYTREGTNAETIILLDQPGAGVLQLMAMSMGPMTCLLTRMFVYGDGATDVAAGAESGWTAWMDEHFPMPTPPEG